jgi:hypothetical protein
MYHYEHMTETNFVVTSYTLLLIAVRDVCVCVRLHQSHQKRNTRALASSDTQQEVGMGVVSGDNAGEVRAMIETDDSFRLMSSSAIAALSFNGHCQHAASRLYTMLQFFLTDPLVRNPVFVNR